MKVALLVVGMYREFETTFKFWNFYDPELYDVYFSTWDETSDENWALNLHTREKVTRERIEKVVNCKRIAIDPLFIAKKKSIAEYIIRIRKGLNLIKFSGIDYSHVLIIRPDFAYASCNVPLFNENIFKIVDDELYTIGGAFTMNWTDPPFRALQDVMFITTPRTAEKFFWFDVNLNTLIDHPLHEDGSINFRDYPCIHRATYLWSEKLKIRALNIDELSGGHKCIVAAILRLNSRGLNPTPDSIKRLGEQVSEESVHWFVTKNKIDEKHKLHPKNQ
jgi:hypothetical protein